EQRNEAARKRPQPLLKADLADENKADAETQAFQQEAGRRLDRLLDALKEQQEAMAAQQQQQQEGEGGEGGGMPPPQGGLKAQDGIPPLAQLKALRGEQAEV